MAVCGSAVPDKDASGDNHYGPSIANQAISDYLWQTYGFSHSSAAPTWKNGWGYENPADTDLPLARTFTACYALTYSAADWQDDSFNQSILNGARKYVRDNINDLRALCGDGSNIATYKHGVFHNHLELYNAYWYQLTVVERASTLVHESRHAGGKSHNANFPPWSAYTAGSGADSDWNYDGAWMWEASYLWWFYSSAVNTTSAMRNMARQVGNFIINNAFATLPGFIIV